MEPISKNKIKWIKSLQLKKYRDLENEFVIEGDKMVLEAIKNHKEAIKCLVLQNDKMLTDELPEHIEILKGSNEDFEKISSLRTPQNSLAVLSKIKKPITREKSLVLALDFIQDPGNLGTIIRLADWFGISEIVCSENTVDCYNPKVIQASMGSIFRVNVKYVDLHKYLKNTKLPIYGALLNGENIYKTTLEKEALLILGNEGNGISQEIQNYIQKPITIPRFGEAESLNVSMATAILLSEFKRS